MDNLVQNISFLALLAGVTIGQGATAAVKSAQCRGQSQNAIYTATLNVTADIKDPNFKVYKVTNVYSNSDRLSVDCGETPSGLKVGAPGRQGRQVSFSLACGGDASNYHINFMCFVK